MRASEQDVPTTPAPWDTIAYFPLTTADDWLRSCLVLRIVEQPVKSNCITDACLMLYSVYSMGLFNRPVAWPGAPAIFSQVGNTGISAIGTVPHQLRTCRAALLGINATNELGNSPV